MEGLSDPRKIVKVIVNFNVLRIYVESSFVLNLWIQQQNLGGQVALPCCLVRFGLGTSMALRLQHTGISHTVNETQGSMHVS